MSVPHSGPCVDILQFRLLVARFLSYFGFSCDIYSDLRASLEPFLQVFNILSSAAKAAPAKSHEVKVTVRGIRKVRVGRTGGGG